MDETALYHELRAACKAVFEAHGIDPANVRLSMLVSFTEARNAAIRHEYSLAKPGEKDAARVEIGKRYGVTERTVCAIVYHKCPE